MFDAIKSLIESRVSTARYQADRLLSDEAIEALAALLVKLVEDEEKR